jgi:hypothetical protein
MSPRPGPGAAPRRRRRRRARDSPSASAPPPRATDHRVGVDPHHRSPLLMMRSAPTVIGRGASAASLTAGK